MPGVYSKFSFAVAQHRAGNFQQAESIYRALIAADPGGRDPYHADALHLLGSLIQSDDPEQSLQLMRRAVEIGAQVVEVRSGAALGTVFAHPVGAGTR